MYLYFHVFYMFIFIFDFGFIHILYIDDIDFYSIVIFTTIAFFFSKEWLHNMLLSFNIQNEVYTQSVLYKIKYPSFLENYIASLLVRVARSLSSNMRAAPRNPPNSKGAYQ